MFQQSRRRLILPFIAPQLILYTIFVFLPLAATIFYGFTDWKGHGNPWEWARFKNYRILWNDGNFHKALKNAVYLMAVGGAAYLVSKSIRSARVLGFADLGMEAIYEFEVQDFPVTVAVDSEGNNVHQLAPLVWKEKIAKEHLLVGA